MISLRRRPAPALSLTLLLASLLTPAGARSAPASGAAGAWGGVPIGVRCSHSAIYDPVRDRMILFGGTDDSSLDDVWAVSVAGPPSRTRLATTGTRPAGRYGHSAIYDPVRDRMVVFAGVSGLDEVWALSLAGTPTWTQLAPTGTAPGARSGHSAIYDPVRDRMVVFGGIGSARLNDVWALSLAGTPAWTQLAPTGTPPGARNGHSAVYDPLRDRMVVFGGALSASCLNDTWELSLAGTPAWTQLAPTGTPPSARSFHAAVYDPVRDRMVVIAGGVDFGLNDTWTLSLAGAPAWTPLTPGGSTLPGRRGHTAIYDPVRDGVVVFGGRDHIYPPTYLRYDDTWTLSLAGSPAWTLTYGARPLARKSHAAIYDPVRDRMVVYGGIGSFLSYNDTWVLPLDGREDWSELVPSGTPPAAGSASAIYDPVRDRMLVLVGTAVRALSLAGPPAWTPVTTAGTPPNGGTALYDPVRDRMLVVTGGVVRALTLSGTPTWSQVSAGGTPPTGESAIYDPVRDQILVFWCSPIGVAVWEYDVSTLPLTGTPTWTKWPQGGGYDMSLVYDSARDRVVGFGGRTPAGDALGGTWALSLAGTPTRTNLAPTGTPPKERWGHRAIYDPVRDRMVVFGGQNWYGQILIDTRALTWEAPPTPVMVSLVSVQAEPDRVRLTWRSAGGGAGVATVYRCGAQGGWSAVGAIAPDGGGQLVYEDRAVTPGSRYRYRLGVADQGGEVFAGETWVDVPRRAELALAGVLPNPASKALAVSFTLPDAGPARLEAFDPAGRRVAALEVGPLGGGSHVVRLGEGRLLAPGVYLLRLTRGDRALTTRAVLVR